MVKYPFRDWSKTWNTTKQDYLIVQLKTPSIQLEYCLKLYGPVKLKKYKNFYRHTKLTIDLFLLNLTSIYLDSFISYSMAVGLLVSYRKYDGRLGSLEGVIVLG